MESYDTSILKVTEYIERRINQKITLEELSREAAFSKYHFMRIFKALTKETLNEYVRKRRLTLAAKELIESDTSLIQIALKYDYASQEAFSRTFSSYMGTSPLSYRKKVHIIITYIRMFYPRKFYGQGSTLFVMKHA